MVVGCLVVVRLGVLGYWFGGFFCWVVFGFDVMLVISFLWCGWCNMGFLVVGRVLVFCVGCARQLPFGWVFWWIWYLFQVVLCGWWLSQVLRFCCLVFGFDGGSCPQVCCEFMVVVGEGVFGI